MCRRLARRGPSETFTKVGTVIVGWTFARRDLVSDEHQDEVSAIGLWVAREIFSVRSQWADATHGQRHNFLDCIVFDHRAESRSRKGKQELEAHKIRKRRKN